MTKKYLRNMLGTVLLFFALTTISRAQSIVTGGISGTITDPTGAVVVDATLVLTNPSTGDLRPILFVSCGSRV